VVGAAIVHENQFKAVARGLHDHLQAVVEFGDVFLLVVEWNND
jgi:hypothetical protein